MTDILHNPRCSKSRAALAILNDKGLNPTIIEYLKNPLSQSQIKSISKKLGLKPSQFIRKAEYAKLGVNMADTEEGIIAQMAEYPILIERPIVINGNKAKVGRPPESILEII